MVLALLRRDSLRANERHGFEFRVENKQLIGALSDLTLAVVHEAAAKD